MEVLFHLSIKYRNITSKTSHEYLSISEHFRTVLVAEIIAHYCPDLVDTRHFFRCYSYANKYSNWDFLNRKVFPELGFELKKAVIYNLIRPFGCGKHDPLCSKTPAIYSVSY
jgi:hypothetical protein